MKTPSAALPAGRDDARSSVDLPEHDVERAHDAGHVGQHVTAAHEIHRAQMRKARRANLALVRFVGAVGDQEDAELALGRLDRGIHFALSLIHISEPTRLGMISYAVFCL